VKDTTVNARFMTALLERWCREIIRQSWEKVKVKWESGILMKNQKITKCAFSA